MKYNCELVQDLLPLYAEDLCSSTSRQIVEQHLGECERCRALTAPLPIREAQDTPAADRAVKRSMRKVKRRWLAALLAAVLLIPMLLLCFNQYRGIGLCFTNLDDVCTAWRFLRALQTENWEAAAKLHDYAEDYYNILTALEMDESEWSVTCIPVALAGYDYAAKSCLLDKDAVPHTPQELYGFLYNRAGSAMVPLALWEQLIDIDPGAFSQSGGEYWLNGERYGIITTPWGEFVVSEGGNCDTAYDCATCFDLIPAAIYAEARPALEEEAARLYTATHNDIGWVAELTEAEYEEEMIRRYISDLESLEGSVSFDRIGCLSVQRMVESWEVRFSATITRGSQTLDAEIYFSVADGRIRVVGISHENAPHWLDTIDRVLYPSAHPGY